MTDRPEAGCGAAIFDESGRLLLIQRLREPEAGAWGLPGGKIDFGEPARETARREVAEELGIEIAITGLACMSEIIDGGDGRHWVSPIFFGRVVSGTPRLMEPEKHGGFGWYALDALPAPLTSPTRALLATVKTAPTLSSDA
ncbi:NUDIX domain-containing protein [Hyphomonas johnsonii]|jgi:ADP-ribose pyrophosphatase YjhB (NUDIX family)|uniref:NUDIX family NudH subfamily hydrolase n=1 Tax=Hyphomonas johnsonii MHS-2 TaxID=1280950 RepID=A0A059F9V7_9PROT|nr:NUDIX domain-containing protein [Hyphomonas johnsonii]KCZ87346.1 NUDIX family NudH subfamily hydrolase [Hyphomonas johnsonii MHS-2]